jgi:hypothetical protein
MSRLTNLALALAGGSIAMTGLLAVPAHAATTTVERSLLVGKLGFEGGPYPGGFHPTAGTVEVNFNSLPLSIVKSVGKSGKFKIRLSPGGYAVTGCGPSISASATSSGLCGTPQNVNLKPGEVDHIKLVWAYTP